MFTEDLSTFFSTQEFAQSATLGGVAVAGILDLAPAVSFDTLAGTAPTFVLPSASVTADPRGLVLIVGSSNFWVRDFSADGTGVTTLQLEAV